MNRLKAVLIIYIKKGLHYSTNEQMFLINGKITFNVKSTVFRWMCVFFLLSIHTKYSSEPFLLCESVMVVRKRRITSWDRIPDQTRVPVPYFQAITSLQFYVDTLNYFQRWNPKYSFQLEKRKENTLRSLILAFPNTSQYS